mgnify:CR=1 FL=1
MIDNRHLGWVSSSMSALYDRNVDKHESQLWNRSKDIFSIELYYSWPKPAQRQESVWDIPRVLYTVD